MHDKAQDVIVVGGGISGLTTAWHLKKAGVDVTLIEAKETVGGCTRTDRVDGFLLEKGPFNVMIRDPAFEDLIDGVSGNVNVIRADESAKKRYIYRRGRLMPVPAGPFGLMTTPLLPFGGRCRLLAGLLVSARPRHGEETIEQAATRRFGRAACDTLVSAVIAGIFAGDIRKLSLSACFPSAGRIDASARSLLVYGLRQALRAALGTKNRRRRRWRGLVSIDGGLGALTGALGAALGADLLIGRRTEAIRQTDNGFELDIGPPGADRKTLRCRRLVIATSRPEAVRLLKSVVPVAADVVDSIESASLVVLNLGYRRSDVGHPMDGFGFLVPGNEPEFPLMGALFADSVFPHHAPDDRRLLRVFIGGSRDPNAVDRTDDELIATATCRLRDLLEIRGEPVLVDVCRYKEAIPQYHLGHGEKIARLQTAVDAIPGLHVVGNYLDGVSLNDCVRLATETARDLIGAGVIACASAPVRKAGMNQESRAVVSA